MEKTITSITKSLNKIAEVSKETQAEILYRVGAHLAKKLMKKQQKKDNRKISFVRSEKKYRVGAHQDPAKTIGISLPRSQWDAIDELTGGRNGRRSRFVQDAVTAAIDAQTKIERHAK